jgi:non-ribosomal peptide synthetase component F
MGLKNKKKKPRDSAQKDADTRRPPYFRSRISAGSKLLPRDRVDAIVERARLRAIVAQACTEPSLPATGVTMLRLEAGDALDDQSFRATMPPYVFGETIACVIDAPHASGAAVGVEVSHGGLSNLIVGQVAAFELRPGDRVLQYASIGSGTSVSEIFTALASGAPERDRL